METQALIAQLIAEWRSSPGNDDDPLSISLEGTPEYLPLLQPKPWYHWYGRRRQDHRALGLSVTGEWVEDGPGKGRVSRTFGSAATCFGKAPFALAPLALARERYPALRELIWNEREVAHIEEGYLSQWQTLVAALQDVADDEPRDDAWLYRHDLLSVEVALGHLETPRTIATLVAALRSPAASVRQRAVRGLSGTTPGRGREREVIELADDESAAVRAEVAHALAAIGTRAALPILLTYLHDEPPIGVAAIKALVIRGFPEARGEIARVAGSARAAYEDEATSALRVAAILALQTFWTPDDGETLVQYLQAAAPAVRAAAAFALGEMRVAEAADDLYPLLRDATPEVRTSAAWSLGKLGHDEIIPRLIELAHDGVAYFSDPVLEREENERSIALLTVRTLAEGGSAKARAAYEALGLSLE